MRPLLIVLLVGLVFVGAAGAQAKRMTGVVDDFTIGTNGRWAEIYVRVGSKTYMVETEGARNPKITGDIYERRAHVTIYYTAITPAPRRSIYTAKLIATKVVHVR